MAKNAAVSKVELAGEVEMPRVKRAAKGTSTPAAAAPKGRQIHKVGEVNISAYFPAEMKTSLRMVQAKTGKNVKKCLAEALRDLFKKHNVPVPVWARELT
jgi:hypothetical protein